jgi:hypothetical protein
MYLFKDLNLKEEYQDFIESFTNDFAYGDCFLLAELLAEKYDLNVGIIRSEPSGMIIHGFVMINEEYALDAHGIDKLENTIKRYKDFCFDYGENEISFEIYQKDYGIKEMNKWSSFDEDCIKLAITDLEEFIRIVDLKNNIEEYKKTKKNKIKPL